MSSSVDAQGLKVRYYRSVPYEQAGHVDDLLEVNLDQSALILCDVFGLAFDEPAETVTQRSGPLKHHQDTLLAGPPDHFARQSGIVRDVIAPLAQGWREMGGVVVYLENRYSNVAQQQAHIGPYWLKTCDFDIENHYGVVGHSAIVAPKPGDYVVPKHLDDGFFRTELDGLFRNLGVQTLVFTGFSAEACLLSTFIGAFHHGYQPVLVRDACLGQEFPDTHYGLQITSWAIRVMEATRGYSTTSSDVLDFLGGR